MSFTLEKVAIRPFTVEIPEVELKELRARIAATRRPEKETVADQSQFETVQELARYWAAEYDWRKVKAKPNALPRFITEIGGLDVHLVHVRSKHENALPLMVTHGWPGSIIEPLAGPAVGIHTNMAGVGPPAIDQELQSGYPLPSDLSGGEKRGSGRNPLRVLEPGGAGQASSLDDAERQKQVRKTALASIVGTLIEWYDFFLVGTAAAGVLKDVFFPSSSYHAGTLSSFTTYAVGFAARPVGAAIFGRWGDRLGRKATRIATRLLMGVAGVLRGTNTIGVAAPWRRRGRAEIQM